MKLLLLFFGLVFISLKTSAQQPIRQVDSSFALSNISVGLGSNMSKKQPVFKVKGSQFIYTLEEAWETKGFKKVKPDTVIIGKLRTSSIDSILIITTKIKGDSVYKLNAEIMSGGIIYLDIVTSQRNLNFELDNSNDLTARKIVDILNSYIPDKYQKLWICDISATIIEIK